MDQSIQEKIAQRLAELPADVRQAIQSAAWESKLQEIGHRHALHIDQIGILENETLLVMLGFASAEEFSAQIAQQLQIPPDKAQLLTIEINTGVFLPIRESMKHFMEERSKKESSALGTPPPPAAPTTISSTPAAPKATPSPTSSRLPTVGTPALAAPEPKPAQPAQDAPKPVDLHVETILSSPTSSVTPQQPATPPENPVVKVDPYREPVE